MIKPAAFGATIDDRAAEPNEIAEVIGFLASPDGVVPSSDGADDHVVVGVPRRYLPSSAQTADAWTERSCASRAPVGAAMLSDVVTDRRPSAVAAAHCT